MSRDNSPPDEREITTDRDRIETWADDYEAVPVRREEGDEPAVDLVPEAEREETHEELTWDDFHQELDRNEMVVAHTEGASRPFDVHQREELLDQATTESQEIEDALLEGETVTTTITETAVVEQTVVEEATLESEVVDRRPVESTIVDAEFITREVDHCEVTDVAADDIATDYGMFEAGYEVPDTVTVDIEVDEGWTVTRELVDQLTIETRIVDTEATETETLESDTFEETVDIEGVQETILQGDLLESDATASDVIDSGSIESEFREGEVIETTLLERQTVEEELSVRKQFSGEIGNGSTIDVETITSQPIESSIAADQNLDDVTVEETRTVDEGMADESVSGGGMAGDSMADEPMTEGTTDEPMAEGMADEPMAEGTADEPMAEGTMDEPMDEGTTGTAAAGDESMPMDESGTTGDHPMPTDADEGKTVVDATGEEVGMVVEVESDTIYVDPHPSLTDRIKHVLDWGGRDEDSYPLDADHISTITDDEVQLSVDEDR